MFLKLISESNYKNELQERLSLIKEYQSENYIPSFDGLKLRYRYYYKQENKATIIIVHGFTEFLDKYEELCVYFFELGYNVFVYDQRGHGFSGRLVDDIQLAHVGKFIDYEKDLEVIVNKVVRPIIGEQPLYIFSHSMGGAVTTLYIENHSDISGAVLSSPMVVPAAQGIPKPIIMCSVFCGIATSGKKAQFKHTGRFTADVNFNASSDQSFARFRYNLDKRIEEDHFKLTPASNGWMYNAMTVSGKMIKNARKISVPVLIISAEKDSVVKNNMQQKLANRIENCRLETISNAKHSIFTSEDEILKKYYSILFDFLGNSITF